MAAGACSQIIGVSGYEIDPSLDEDTKSVGGAPDAGEGGADTLPTAGKGGGGAPHAGEGGVYSLPTAGKGGSGAGAAGRDMGGSAGRTSSGGEGGDAPKPAGCLSSDECDDGIDCTEDVCQPNGTCRSTADDSACETSKCQTCQLGVGCVAGPTTTIELLTDPGFDGTNEDWVETSITFDDQNIFPDDFAVTAPNVAKFGPAPLDAEEQEYADLLQYVVIPERTVGITLSGYYKLTPGATLADEDYAVAAFYESGATEPSAQFHEWPGDSAAQSAWKSFSYNAPKSDVADMVGGEYSFDLVAYSWQSVFLFDSLKLTATVCAP